MPTQDEHLGKAQHNQRFYENLGIDTTDFLDWLVTGLFYCALHYIDAYLAVKPIHPHNHKERNDCLNRIQELRGIREHYRALRDDCRDARYGFHPVGMREFSVPEVQQLRDYDLATIRTYVLQLLENNVEPLTQS